MAKIAGLQFNLINDTANGKNPLPFPVQTLLTDESPTLPEDCISIRKGDSPDKLVHYMTKTGVWNTIQDESEFFKDRLFLSAHLIQNPNLFFVKPTKEILAPTEDLIPGEKLISERRWKFRSSVQKHEVINDIKSYLMKIPGAKGVAETALIIAEELYTNALFNAPFGDLNSTLDRSTLVVLDPEMAVEIIVGSTENRLFVGCIDSFGTLSCENLLERIYNGFNAGFNKSVNMEMGGAGIGVLRMVDLASDIYAIVERDKRTLIGCGFVLKRSSKKIRQTAKTFHFQSFQNIVSPSGVIRVERRGPVVLLRISGDIKADFPFAEIDLTDTKEIILDLRLLSQVDPQILRIPLEIFKNTPSIEKFNFEYVPHSILTSAIEMVQQSEEMGNLRSIALPFFCTECKTSSIFFFSKCEVQMSGAQEPRCSKCRKVMEPDEDARKLIQL